jgi:transketolase
MTSKELAYKIRYHAVNMTHTGNSSHIGGVLSIADILAVLYNDILKVFPDDPKHPDRDRFILSKGHAGAGVYAVLAEKGFFPVDMLKQHYQNGSLLSGHVSHKGIPGVELSTGSLGHGLPIGCGMAYAAKLDKKLHKVVVLMSDGECDEGSNWEAIMFAAHHHLNNLVAIVDYNKIQSLDKVANTLGLEPFEDKWKAFGWNTYSIDGHNHTELINTLKTIWSQRNNQPNVIIANTIKGKGISFMENKVLWHYRSPQGDEFKQALKELKENNA